MALSDRASLVTRFLPDTTREALARLADGALDSSAASAESGAVLAALAAAAHEAPLVVVAPTVTLAERIGSVVRWLLEQGPLPFAFPRWPRGAESPYEDVVESPFVAAARSGVLGALCLSETPAVLCLDAATAARRLMPFDAFLDGVLKIEVGREVDLGALSAMLVAAGYRRASTVSEVGEFAVRGGVVDVFPPSQDDPIRFELDGDEVASLKVFDPASQRGQRPVRSAWIVPAWDVPADPGRLREGLIGLRDGASTRRVPAHDVALVEELFKQGRLPPAFGAMMPFLYGTLDDLGAYLPETAVVAVWDPDGCRAAADAALGTLEEQFRELGDAKRLVAKPGTLACDGAGIVAALSARPRALRIVPSASGDPLGPPSASSRCADLTLATAAEVPVEQRVAALVRIASGAREAGQRVLVLAPSEAESRRVREILSGHDLDASEAPADGMLALLDAGARPGVRVGTGRVKVPFGLEAAGATVVPSEAVFGVKDVLAGRRGERRAARAFTDLRELAPGDLVIHRDHGVGRFEGLRLVEANGRTTECLLLSYKSGDRLYVPVDRANLLDKYTTPAEGSGPDLDRLGGQAWGKRKRSARAAVREIAGMLKAIYARRAAATTHAFPPPDAELREFEATFPYDTTPDQEKVIEEVYEDLANERPMDRLVCGDVGFGKTEVAVRAAYRAASEGKQVAVLVPTTLLAEQHRLTFAARFRHLPFTVASLSRLKTGQSEREVLQSLKTGGMDIVIGTHRLLSKDVVFRDLGLLIVDEEHRFGVAHKERLREMAASVHTLTLSATPIPRTLHMSLAGIRELSVIATPPRDRLAVKTFVARPSRELIRSAILRELARGGQVFYLHNRVEDIYEFAKGVAETVPEARVTVAHGQMTAPDLEGVMSAFVRGEKDVLVCTTIIESGLDIGTANTILVGKAESLGLAQLYQLRGRVGRASEQAYCYLLVRDPSTLTEDARKRIEAIERFSELASGFNLAAMDMEIRGAGNVLGAEQSGHMAAVGYDLFMEMLQEAIAELSGQVTEERPDPELKVDVEVRIPAEYVDDERLRLRFYKRLAASREESEVSAVAAELTDRFGAPPRAVTDLVRLMRVKVLARDAGLAGLVARAGSIVATACAGHERALDGMAATAQSLNLRLGDRARKDTLTVLLPKTVEVDVLEAAERLLSSL